MYKDGRYAVGVRCNVASPGMRAAVCGDCLKGTEGKGRSLCYAAGGLTRWKVAVRVVGCWLSVGGGEGGGRREGGDNGSCGQGARGGMLRVRKRSSTQWPPEGPRRAPGGSPGDVSDEVGVVSEEE